MVEIKYRENVLHCLAIDPLPENEIRLMLYNREYDLVVPLRLQFLFDLR